MTFRKSNIKNCSFGCFFYAFMSENWMTEMPENWEITDISGAEADICNGADAATVEIVLRVLKSC